MIVGIVADSHDNLAYAEAAVKLFSSRRCKVVIHAGDIISPFTAKKFISPNWQLYAVRGNNDGEKKGLKKLIPGFSKPPIEIEIDGRRVFVAHKAEQLAKAVGRLRKYVGIHAHDHIAAVTRRATSVIINPGECCGYLTGKATVAIWNSKTDNVDIIEL